MTAPSAIPAKNMDFETNIKFSRSQYKLNYKKTPIYRAKDEAWFS